MCFRRLSTAITESCYYEVLELFITGWNSFYEHVDLYNIEYYLFPLWVGLLLKSICSIIFFHLGRLEFMSYCDSVKTSFCNMGLGDTIDFSADGFQGL